VRRKQGVGPEGVPGARERGVDREGPEESGKKRALRRSVVYWGGDVHQFYPKTWKGKKRSLLKASERGTWTQWLEAQGGGGGKG